MDVASGPATSSVLTSGESLNPLGDHPQKEQNVSEVETGIQDATKSLSFGPRPSLFSSSKFLVGSDVSAMAAPPQEVKRSLFNQFGTSFGSSLKSALGSAKRDATRTPSFTGFGKMESLQVNQSVPFEYYVPEISDGFDTTTSLASSRRRKVNPPSLGVSFINDPPSVCGAPIGNSGRFCMLPKDVCSTDTHKKKGTTLREISLSC